MRGPGLRPGGQHSQLRHVHLLTGSTYPGADTDIVQRAGGLRYGCSTPDGEYIVRKQKDRS